MKEKQQHTVVTIPTNIYIIYHKDCDQTIVHIMVLIGYARLHRIYYKSNTTGAISWVGTFPSRAPEFIPGF